ncbi:hypothetical protein Ddc_13131 [Ditylenchus destructor]|nr:hypothetical protein Ddc_13131 [Ditylenchus destructor]
MYNTPKVFSNTEALEFLKHTVSDDEHNKLAYLFENAFIEPAKIILYEHCDIVRRQLTQAKGVLNCKKLKISYSSVHQKFHQESHGALLNWLHNDYREDSKKVHHESKHLVLICYPRKMILDMVKHLKEALEKDISPTAAYLITFLGFDFHGPCVPFLEGDHSFYLTKTSTNEKLSFIKQNQNDNVYRLWRRQVICESSDLEMEDQYKRTDIDTSVLLTSF